MVPTSSNNREPVYLKLATLLEGMIRNESLRAGDRVPSVRQFSRQQRVSVPTALQAYATLETRGFIEARPKSGFFVRARLADLVREPAYEMASPKITRLSEASPLDSLLSDPANPGVVPLGAAIPSGEVLPTEKLARSMGAIARKLGSRSAGYDMAPGNPGLRQEIARRSLEHGGSLKPDEIMLTVGCTEALSLALRATCRPGDTVIIESATYYNLVAMLRELELNALPIRMSGANGMDLDALESTLKRARASACVVIPNFNNPTGSLMPDENKRRLVEILARREIPIIEDDIYGDLKHEGPRPYCLKAFDRNGLVLLCSSFSKTLAPGYRAGYIAAGRWQDRVLRLKKTTTMAGALLPALAVGEFLKNGGYDRYLRTLRMKYRQQVAQMREAIVETFPEGIGLSRPQGGFVLWCELPVKVDSVELYRQARAADISIAPGPLFSANGSYKNFMRLNCGHPWNPQIERSIGILGHLVKKLAGR